MTHDLWIKCYEPRPAARLRLFCFPYAGGGASTYHTWSQHLPEQVEVAAVQLPGREDRFREEPFHCLAQLVETLAPVVADRCDIPFACFGHSMGGLIAFELARHLRQTGAPMPDCLFLSGRRAPDQPDPLPPIPDLPAGEFVRELQRRYGGFPDVIANDPQLRSLFLPMIRADLELVNTYVYRPGPPLDCPISAYGGLRDSIALNSLEAWQAQTTGDFRLQMLPGDHFFINTGTAALLRPVSEQLNELIGNGAAADQ
jgi:medium-chain acyl-[acyl-carrier-protein] hydrolase